MNAKCNGVPSSLILHFILLRRRILQRRRMLFSQHVRTTSKKWCFLWAARGWTNTWNSWFQIARGMRKKSWYKKFGKLARKPGKARNLSQPKMGLPNKNELDGHDRSKVVQYLPTISASIFKQSPKLDRKKDWSGAGVSKVNKVIFKWLMKLENCSAMPTWTNLWSVKGPNSSGGWIIEKCTCKVATCTWLTYPKMNYIIQSHAYVLLVESVEVIKMGIQFSRIDASHCRVLRTFTNFGFFTRQQAQVY